MNPRVKLQLNQNPLSFLHCLAELLTKKFADLQNAWRSLPRSWGHKVTEIKKPVTFSFYFAQRKRFLKIFHHRFPSESSQPIYINETAPVKEPVRKRRKLSAPKICSKDKSSISQGRGDLNAFLSERSLQKAERVLQPLNDLCRCDK